jgi:deazaflavin-dependent oxidoreductase (nitroreductase family)
MGLLSLFGINRTVMLLITRGCKTGKIRYTPIGYFDISGKRYLISAWGKNTGWFRNLTANPKEVWIQIGLKRQPVKPVLLQDKGEMLSVLEALILESPDTARYLFGWDPEVDRFSNADFSPILELVLFIRFEQCNS